MNQQTEHRTALALKRCCSVIGMGFGDEGKGMCVHYLTKTKTPNTIVIRHSGGQQAGHTVYKDKDTFHVFANFGSGTFNGVPTYWSKYCTFDPVATWNEYNVLKQKKVKPVLYIDRKCPVTTPLDIIFNRNCPNNTAHGTVGVGVGATFKREEDHFSLLVEDLLDPKILKIKLKAIEYYYQDSLDHQNFEHFMSVCDDVINQFHVVNKLPHFYNDFIFEGSQGLLLDQNIGFFPHVTRSNTGTKNIIEMGYTPEVYLVTRSYQTRHGNGPMTCEEYPVESNPYETNKQHLYQGEFRTAMLDMDLLRYAVSKDEGIQNAPRRNLFVTCMDMLKSNCFAFLNVINEFKDRDEMVEAMRQILNINGETVTTETPWLEE